MLMKMKQYLGDGVYAAWDGFAIVLTTEDGISAQNTIYLEPQVVEALQRYIKTIYESSEE